MRAGKNDAKGTSGQSHIKALFEEFGWAVVANPEHDLGTDLWVSPRDARRFDLRLMLGVQVKNSASYFSEPGELEGRSGWWHRDSRAHFEHWSKHGVPHVLVLRDVRTATAYWAQITSEEIVWTGVNGKLFVPETQILDADALPKLIDIASTIRPRPRWAGSALTGASGLAPTERLRYALLAPRLVAPHPNAGTAQPDAPGALALLTAGRFRELDRYGLMDESQRKGAGWALFYGLWKALSLGDLLPIRTCYESVSEPHELAAASAVLAALLFQDGAYDEALAVVEAAIAQDRCAPTDQAWLAVHQARCLAEIGERERAIELAASVQGVTAIAPDDVTASAIAASGALLVFQNSAIFEGDVASTITATDTETSWWRSQALAWGLDNVLKESFRQFSRESVGRFGRPDPTDRVRGVSLTDGFAGAQDDWRHSTSLLATAQLMTDDLTPQDAAWWLTLVRRAGDRDTMTAAIAHLLEGGPAAAVRDAADAFDLDSLAHTEARASIELVVRGADVLSADAAEAAARWALQDDSSLERWLRRARPVFNVHDQRAAILAAVYPNLSLETKADVRTFVAGLPQLSDQAHAHAWARPLSSVPIADWSQTEVAVLLGREGDHWELDNAIRRVGVERNAECRAANDAALRAGSLKALEFIGPITNLPSDAVGALVAAAGTSVREEITQARSGLHTFGGGLDLGMALALMNLYFPDSANWAVLLDLLTEPAASRSMLAGVLLAIGGNADRLPDETRSRLAGALSEVVGRPKPRAWPTDDWDPAPAALAALDAVKPGIVDLADWNQFHGPEARTRMCQSVGRRKDPHDLSLLVALLGDQDPRVRGAAAWALSHWAVQGVETERSLTALAATTTDPGSYVARCVVSGWPEQVEPRLSALAEALSNHISVTVRSAAGRVLG